MDKRIEEARFMARSRGGSVVTIIREMFTCNGGRPVTINVSPVACLRRFNLAPKDRIFVQYKNGITEGVVLGIGPATDNTRISNYNERWPKAEVLWLQLDSRSGPTYCSDRNMIKNRRTR